MSKNSLIIFGVLVALALGALVFVMLAPSKNIPGPTATMTPVVNPAAPQAGAVQEIEVSGSEYKFTPRTLVFTKGEKVKLTFKNMGKMPHNLMIPELNVATDTIAGGETTTVEFTPGESGSFAMFCSVGNHRALGMEGMMEVK
ncbi:cupredoxin domain-containing protein [Candidatus Microgenomates bacterium]|nr:cupredoxin domain-containing protein [Candidatus Microgenomates bacterium]